HLETTRPAPCARTLAGYAAPRGRGGRPVVRAARNTWLAEIAVRQVRNPRRFWDELRANDPAEPPVPAAILRRLLPPAHGTVRFLQRLAGKGSLGRKRCVVLTDAVGGHAAHAAKALVPSAAAWVE